MAATELIYFPIRAQLNSSWASPASAYLKRASGSPSRPTPVEPLCSGDDETSPALDYGKAPGMRIHLGQEKNLGSQNRSRGRS
jgi:hypothetical protein